MTAEPSEAGLVKRARTGEAEALSELFHRYSGQVYDVAMRITASTHDADDVTQDLFVGLPEALSAYSGSGPLDAWLRKVATRMALLFLRQRRRQARWEREAVQEIDPRKPADRIETRLTLEGVIQRMPDDLRLVFVLREIEGYPHEEIAELLDITEGASYTRLHRARQFLRARLMDRI